MGEHPPTASQRDASQATARSDCPADRLSCEPPGPTGAVDGAEHPRAIYKRAIERGNVLIAEMAAREVGSLTLSEALELVCLYAGEAQPARFERAALPTPRWREDC